MSYFFQEIHMAKSLRIFSSFMTVGPGLYLSTFSGFPTSLVLSIKRFVLTTNDTKHTVMSLGFF